MKKIAAVEEAKALFTEAASWSVMKWLSGKKHVRATADKCNNALWAMQQEVKSGWGDDLKSAYNELLSNDGEPGSPRRQKTAKETSAAPQVRALAKQVYEADEAAWRAHVDAEETFANADKRLSTSLAREGCKIAINSWELYENAIEKAEAGLKGAKAGA